MTWKLVVALASAAFALATTHPGPVRAGNDGSTGADRAAPEAGARRVAAVRRDPHGHARGVILDNGTAVVAEELDRLFQVARPGEVVQIVASGRDVELRNVRTGALVALGPREPLTTAAIGGGPRAVPVPESAFPRIETRGLVRLNRTGVVRQVVHTTAGVPFGLVLDDGSQVYLLPRVSGVLSSVTPGERVAVHGLGTQAVDGTAMWAQTIARDDGRTVLDLGRGPVRAPELGLRGP